MRRSLLLATLIAPTLIVAADNFTSPMFQSPVTPTPAATAIPVELLVPEVISVRPHDTNSFTEGLVWDAGRLFESAGEYGRSDVREVDPVSGLVLRKYAISDKFFGEGLALVDDRLFQLTWREEVAFLYDADSFAQMGAFSYTGAGWGLCYDGESLYMSNGSATITRRDPQTFDVLEEIGVTYQGQPLDRVAYQGQSVSQLNELECVGDSLYVNIWLTNLIMRIDKGSGLVNAVIFAEGLLTQEEYVEAAGRGGVLNGIAYMPETDTFLITGKYWPKMFEVRFVSYKG